MGITMILKAENLVKTYQNNQKLKLEVLKSVSIEIEEKNISVIVGASGAGKSTLLHLLSGLDRPDSGSVFYEEQDIFKLSDDKLTKFRNKNIGFVFQFHHLLPEFTAVGSSAKIIAGSFASALATATLCCSPPESSAGL